MKQAVVLLALISMVLTMTGCPIFRPSSAGSLLGSVPEGAAIWTPNKKYSAKKVGGDVVIFEDKEEVFCYKNKGYTLRAMAFSPDSERIAFIHPSGSFSDISEYQIGSSALYSMAQLEGFYYNMRYNKNGVSVIVGCHLKVELMIPTSVGFLYSYRQEGAAIWTLNRRYMAQIFDGDILIFEDGEEIFCYQREEECAPRAMAFSPDSERIAILHYYFFTSTVSEYQIGSSTLYASGRHRSFQQNMRYSEDGTRIIFNDVVSVDLERINSEGEGEGEGEGEPS